MSVKITELDARGLTCPMPLLKAKQALNKLQDGDCLRVLATDGGSVRDFKSFTDLSTHQLLSSEEVNGVFIYTLKKQSQA